MVWTLYTQQLHKRPLLTQALMSGTVQWTLLCP